MGIGECGYRVALSLEDPGDSTSNSLNWKIYMKREVFRRHAKGRTMSTELIPSIPNELLSIYLTRGTSRASLATIP